MAANVAAHKFRNCKMHVLQSREQGHVHAILMQQTSACDPWMRRLMLGAAKMMVPVREHKSGVTEFSNVEGHDRQLVQYRVDKASRKHVVSTEQLLREPPPPPAGGWGL